MISPVKVEFVRQNRLQNQHAPVKQVFGNPAKVHTMLRMNEKKGGGQPLLLRAPIENPRISLPGDNGATRPKIGLALAGGFARGIAHIGVLRVLREARIPIDMVAGTSVGALIGTCYCAGVTPEAMERLAHHTTFADFGRWTPSWLGLATNLRLEQYVKRLTPMQRFEELVTPLAITATDINSGLSVYFREGPLGPPLRASCAYPGLFVPVQYDDRTLVDGFLTSLVPVEGVRLMGADVVIAVYLEAGSIDKPRTFTDVLSRSFTIIQKQIDAEWRKRADVIIEPNVKPFVWDDFSKSSEMVRAGEEATLKLLPVIRAAIAAKKIQPVT
jgi:NTE family protein